MPCVRPSFSRSTLLLATITIFAGMCVEAKICANINVRNYPSQLAMLRNCTVVEGHVQIVLMERATEEQFEQWSFPELREITHFLLFYRIKGLRSVGQLFPNLVRIGGASLFIDYGLVVHEMFHLQDIGLSNLKEVSRGSVILTKNPGLCFVNTINWDSIAKWGPVKNYVANNRLPGDCPTCAACPQGLCWSQAQCQVLTEPAECHPLCVGGCSGPSPYACHSCRGVLTPDNMCVQKCPEGMYEYLNRRCITRKECESIYVPMSTISGFNRGPDQSLTYFVFNGTCTDSCPSGFVPSKAGGGCERCVGDCPRWCQGMCIENIGDAQLYRGCTHIKGALEITIKTGKPKVVAHELEENLGSIEEIEGYLKIVRSFPITDLKFLKNLTVIHGNPIGEKVFGDDYSLLVLENQNLQDLWDWNAGKKLKILKGKVFFHYNPKLCLEHIYRLLSETHRDRNVSSLEVGKDSNGDKFPCNSTEFDINITFKSAHLIQLRIPYLNIKYDTTVLRYVVYFIKDNVGNITMFDEMDQCSDYNWRTIDVSIDPQNETLKNGFPVELNQLEPNTQYAFYATMYTLDLFGAKSAMYYVTTMPSKPTELTRLEAISLKSNEIQLQWEPPEHVNGKIDEYLVTWSPLQYNDSIVRMRNYCEHQLNYVSETETWLSDIDNKELSDNKCCSKNALHIPKDGFENLCSNYDHCQLPNRFSDSDSPMSCESCFYSYVYDQPKVRNSTFSNLFTKKTFFEDNINKTDSDKSEDIITISQSLPGNTTEFVISKLMHFKDYVITVRACRETVPEELNVSNNDRCSEKDIIIVKTQKDYEADRIPSAISYEVINGTVYISWESPYNPNGLIVAFEIEYQHLDAENYIKDCLPFSEYEYNKGRFSIVGLAPGEYEVRVRAISLSGKGPVTAYMNFKISNGKLSVFDIFIVAIFLSLAVVLITLGASVYKKKRTPDILVASVNPEYQYIQDHWEIPRDDIELISELGSGSFGKVYEGLLKSSNTPCAIKTVSDTASEYDNFMFLSEASVMKSVIGAYYIVRLLGVVSTVQPPLVVMELMSLGDLKTYLRSTRESQPPSNATKISMALQIGDGMAYMEAKKFVHRDLAARNCMVNKDGVVKVGDFGMTRDIYETDYYRKVNTGLLPIRWMAPESLKDGVFTCQTDVWSYGVVLWEIVTLAEQPYQGSSNDEVLYEVMAGRRLDIPKGCSDTFKNTMLSCWKFKPTQRMTFMQIVTSLAYYHDSVFKSVSFYYTKDAEELRKNSSDYIEMKSVDEPLLETLNAGNVSSFYSKVKNLTKGDVLNRIEAAFSEEE